MGPRHTPERSPHPALALVLGLLLALGLAGVARAQDEVTIRGQVGQTLGFFLTEGSRLNGDEIGDEITWGPGQVSLNRTHYQLQFERRFGWEAAGHISLKGYWDAGVAGLQALKGVANGDSSTLLELDQAYVDLYSDLTDFRIGRQRIAWGTADGFNPTSYFSPLTLDLTRGLEALVQPVTAIRTSTYFNVGTLSVVIVPAFEPSEWERVLQDETGLSVTAENVKDYENPGEIGLQFDTFYRGTSLYLSYFNGYEDQPVVWGDEANLHRAWRREQKVGLAAATAWRGFTRWGEGTYTFPGRVEGLDEQRARRIWGPTKPYPTAVLGVDYLFPRGIRAELQYIYNGRGSLLKIFNESDVPAGQYLMGLASIPLTDDQTLELLALDSLRDDSWVLVPTYRYQLTPTTQASLSLILVDGGPASEVGQKHLSDLDQLTLAVTVRF